MKENIVKKKPKTKKETIKDIEYIVEGNTVKKVEIPIPEKKEKKQKDESEIAKNKRNVMRNRERASAMDLPYLVMLSIALIISFALCANYIAIQSHLTSVIKTTQKNESKLEALKNNNDALEGELEKVDLDHIYEVATKKLGMIYAKKSQVITYEKTESEYVRQFEDIPK